LGQYGDDKQIYGIVYDESFADFDVFAAQIWAMTRKQVTIPAGDQFVMRRCFAVTGLGGQTPVEALNRVYQQIIDVK
jgi:arginine deiminase